MKLSWNRDTFDSIVGVIAMLAAVAMLALHEKILPFLKFLEYMRAPVLWFAAGLLVAVGLGLIFRAWRKRSVLLRPEALRLDARDPRHLIGRDDEIADLSRACLDHPLVFLSGESGAGKSALVQAGLIPALRDEGRLLPLYVDVWGENWERGPAGALADALWRELDAKQRQALSLQERPDGLRLFDVLRQVRAKLVRIPLLIFDQFDDYQTRHRERFLKGRTWLRSEELLRQNAFWKGIADLLKEDAVHTLFVTRADSAEGLESVRFQEPSVHHLDRLASVHVSPLLDRLTASDDAGPVIAHPERGWTRLKIRLQRDLEQDKVVLPQRIKTVLAGLRTLRHLTVGQYDRAGGGAGLETQFVEAGVGRAARMADLEVPIVRGLLLGLVDSDRRAKTIPRRLDQLAARAAAGAPEASVVEQRVTDALEELGRAELVRERVDPDTGERAWLLDHDYLTRPVLDAERRANRWTMLLEEGAKAYEEAGERPVRRWKALLRNGHRSDWDLRASVGPSAMVGIAAMLC